MVQAIFLGLHKLYPGLQEQLARPVPLVLPARLEDRLEQRGLLVLGFLVLLVLEVPQELQEMMVLAVQQDHRETLEELLARLGQQVQQEYVEHLA
jgi:hypothetical protein